MVVLFDSVDSPGSPQASPDGANSRQPIAINGNVVRQQECFFVRRFMQSCFIEWEWSPNREGAWRNKNPAEDEGSTPGELYLLIFAPDTN